MPALPPERPGCPKTPGGRRPLPDPAAIRLFLVPESAPPYDEDVPAGDMSGGGARQGLWPGRSGVSGPPRDAEPGNRGWPPDGPPRDMEPGNRGWPAPTPSRETEPGNRGPAAIPARGETWGAPAAVPGVPPGWQSRFAQVLAETLAGARPPHQIVPWTTEEALRRIQRLGPRLASEQRPRVRRVLTSRPAPDVMEMTVVVGFGPRVRALAVRLEQARACPAALPGQEVADARAGTNWVCTAVEAA